MTARQPHAFESSHPAVPAVYLGGTVIIAMFAIQPVYVALSLAGGVACSLAFRGVRETVRGLRWQLPVVALVSLVNPLFSASGSTELWRLGPTVVYLESLAFGACMGAMLVAVVLWLESASRVLTQDRLLELGARALPTVTLMVSMTMQLVPQLARRGRTVRSAYAACTAAGGETGGRHAQVRLSDVLVAWAMEDSLERADSMRARGWGSLPTRTTYRSVEFRSRDALVLALSVLLLLANALLASVACGQWHFYPTLPRLVAWWGYVPYAVQVLLPAALELVGRLRWR